VYSKKRTGEPLNKLLCEVERKRKEPTRGEGHYGQIEKGGMAFGGLALNFGVRASSQIIRKIYEKNQLKKIFSKNFPKK